MNTNRILELAGLPAQVGTRLNEEATVNDKIVYTHANHKSRAADADLNGTEYDPDEGTMTVGNRTSLADTHRKLEKAGWKKSKIIKGKVGAISSTDKAYALGD